MDPKQLLERYKPKEIKALKPDRQMCVVRFSPDGNLLAAGGTDGTVRRWDAAADFAELPAITGHGAWVQGLVFHPDGKRLFTTDSWGQLRSWPAAEKEAKKIWAIEAAHDGWIRGLSLSTDGKLLATCGRDQMVRVWSAEDGKKLHEFAGHNEDVLAVAIHPDGKSIVSGDLKGVIKHWILEERAGGVSPLIRTLDAKSLYRLDRLQDVGGVRFLQFDREGKTLAVTGTTPKNGGNVQGVPTILLFDWETGKVQQSLKNGADGDGFVYEMHFHADGFVMAVTSGNPGVGQFFFQRPADPQPFFQAKLPNCHSLALHPNGQRLAVSATNAGSNGNGRLLKGNDYPGNFSPIHVFELPKPAG